MAAEADAIFVDLRGMDVEGTMGSLIAAKRQDAQLVLFAEKGQVAKLSGYLDGITDIWVLPVSGEEFAFRFLRWQQSLKKDRDYRQPPAPAAISASGMLPSQNWWEKCSSGDIFLIVPNRSSLWFISPIK